MTQDRNDMVRSVRERKSRYRDWLLQGEPSLGRYLAQVGVLGWTIVAPTLLGLFLGRWIDRHLGTGIFWTGPLMLLGLAAGCWTGWRWMHKQ